MKIWGCRHNWVTIRFQHVGPAIDNATGLRYEREAGTWQVNECKKCGAIQPSARWSKW